jgi:hypothetical protein
LAFTFEKLLVYQKAIDFADAVCAEAERFPHGYSFLRDQLNRAALSIAANIAEGTAVSQKPTAATSSASRVGPPRNAYLCSIWPVGEAC